MKSQGIKFNDDLIDQNNYNNKEVDYCYSELGEKSLEAYNKTKKYTRNCIYPPFIVEKHPIAGYYLRAIDEIPEFTLLCEYSGEVSRNYELHGSSNDSIFNLIETFSPYVNCCINPERYGNVAEYIAGINSENKKLIKENVRALKANIDGKLHILLYTLKKIKKNEVLYYDYNGGNRIINYDTSFFKKIQ